MSRWADDDVIREILWNHATWAVVGCSPSPYRPSHRVTAALQRLGKRIVPVNPRHDGPILGEATHADLAGVPTDVSIDVVDIFRRSELAGEVVDAAIGRGARAVWLQLGVIDDMAAERADAAGLLVVMDRCPAIEIGRIGNAPT